MKTVTGILLLFVSFLSCVAGAAGVPTTEKEKINYSVGYQIGGDFRKEGIGLDPDMLVQGARDALGDNQALLMSQQDIRRTLVTLKAMVTSSDRKRKGGTIPADPAIAQAYLEQNAKQEGMVTLPSGVQYKILKEGTGKSPTADDNVIVNYRGSLVGEGEFYNSQRVGAPSNNHVGALIAGLQEVLLRMKEGARWQAVVPPAMGYRDGSPLEGKIVIFEIELVEVRSTK